MNTEQTEQMNPTVTPGRGGSDVAPGGAGVAASGRAAEILGQRGLEFVHGELELSRVTGLAVKKLAGARKKLRRGEDWDLRGLRIAYSAAGAARVIELVTGRGDWPLAEALELSRMDEGRAVAVTIVARLVRFPMNRKLVQARVGEELILVRVRSQKNFRRGMELPVRPRADGFYELTRREPRFAGRW